MPTVFIRHRFEHMGAHSGYDLVVPSLLEAVPDAHSVFLGAARPLHWRAERVLRRWAARVPASPFYGSANLRAELQALFHRPLRTKTIHVLYAEDNLGVLARFKGWPGTRVVATIHQPVAWWRRQCLGVPRMLDRLHAVIALSRAEAAAFQGETAAPVHFVPHGVDAAFFTPAPVEDRRQANRPRCLFVGNWLRDFAVLRACVLDLRAHDPSIEFDVVAPERADRDPVDEQALRELVRLPGVAWHRKVDDVSLRDLYRQARVLLLPLKESTANNAVLEALACGLPVVSNRTSGISDYTNPSCAVIGERGDVRAMADAVLQILGDPPRHQAMSAAARQLVEQRYAWPIVARQMLPFYGGA